MTLTPEQAHVLSRIYELGEGATTNPVTIGAIHDTYFHRDVRDLVADLQVLLQQGLIENAGQIREKIGNTFVITPRGIAYHSRDT